MFFVFLYRNTYFGKYVVKYGKDSVNKTAQSGGESALVLLFLLLILIEHPVLRPFDIIVLPALDRPEEKHPSGEAQAQHEEDQEKHAVHQRNLARNEFPTTESELNTMAPAAMMGCKMPSIARGMKTML